MAAVAAAPMEPQVTAGSAFDRGRSALRRSESTHAVNNNNNNNNMSHSYYTDPTKSYMDVNYHGSFYSPHKDIIGKLTYKSCCTKLENDVVSASMRRSPTSFSRHCCIFPNPTIWVCTSRNPGTGQKA